MTMSKKEDIIGRCRASIRERIEKPRLDDIEATVYADTAEEFRRKAATMGAQVVELGEGETIDDVIRRVYPDAKTIASNMEEVGIANRNPDTVAEARDLDKTDVGVVPGMFGVAENGSVWVPQTMKEKAVMFISENLVIVLPKDAVVNNMHEAYSRIKFNDYDYGTFIAGPSKTADIAQVLVTGAQAARSVTLVLT